jgi:hypothetical protein
MSVDATDIDERCDLEPYQIHSSIDNTSADRQRHQDSVEPSYAMGRLWL